MFSIEVGSIIFFITLCLSCALFYKNFSKIIRNINLGKSAGEFTDKKARWKNVFFIAFGQKKMFKKPLVAVLHLIIYLGFVIINIEIIEIILDGILGTHRILYSPNWAGWYNFLINSFEVLALLVLVSCIIFLIRRNIIRISRFHNKEMEGWPTSDANLILIFEILLMSAFLIMNAADLAMGHVNKDWPGTGSDFWISGLLAPYFHSMSFSSLYFIFKFFWWSHILGIFGFLNYLVISKHLHIILAFPNTYYASLTPKGQFNNMSSVTNEVKIMLDPNSDPFSQPENTSSPARFGAKDVTDLTWVQLLNAYSCTECGRCTSECPANVTGKKLSPRKIMMDVRDRTEQLSKGIDKHGENFADEKSLLNDFISPEELWACTSCNACVEACPLNIDPLSIIIDLRRYLVMEEAGAPAELNSVFSNIENNGAPWQFPASDRLKWKEDE
ncbi:MAG: Fe-S oxidoreductase [Flavobacteriales bacterium]|nr:Fe-S oxidoreductase [Flavobacteriales bacterium]|tara:strand:- start:682 stop:2013 length:1332 start_codon:yes stop_codon:yes gene_type:complete